MSWRRAVGWLLIVIPAMSLCAAIVLISGWAVFFQVIIGLMFMAGLILGPVYGLALLKKNPKRKR